MNPFSFCGAPNATIGDLMQVAGSYGAIPGLPRYNPELDVNHDSVINILDLTTVAANM